MGTQKESGLVSRAVREALGTLVSPQVSAQLVERALASAGLTVIPETGPEVTAWVEGPLRKQVESYVGVDAAELVSAQLAPIAAHAAGAARAASPAPKPDSSLPAPRNAAASPVPKKQDRSPGPKKQAPREPFSSDHPTGVVSMPQAAAGGPSGELRSTARIDLTDAQRRAIAGVPNGGNTRRPQGFQVEAQVAPARRVLAASTATEAVVALQRYLGSAAHVEQVSDLVGLLDALEEPGDARPIVVVDCQHPTVHVSSIAAVGEDLPKGTTVVLWGSSEATWHELDRTRTPSCRWVRCSQEATFDDVGSLCVMLLGS